MEIWRIYRKQNVLAINNNIFVILWNSLDSIENIKKVVSEEVFYLSTFPLSDRYV